MLAHIPLSMTILGPFEYKAFNSGILVLEESKFTIVELNTSTTFKLELNKELPFLFNNAMSNLRNQIGERIKQSKSIEILFNNEYQIKFHRAKYWKHFIQIDYENRTYKLTISDRENANNYLEILKNNFPDRLHVVDGK